MKKITVFMTVFLLTFTLAACGGNASEGKASGGGDGEPITLKVSCMQVEDHENTKAMRRIQERVERETDGRLKLELYPDSVLGDYTVMFEEAMLGSVDMVFQSLPGQYDKRLEMTFIPYLFTNYQEAAKVFSPGSDTYGVYESICDELGLKAMGIYGEGFVGVGTTELDPNYAEPTAKKSQLIRVPAIETNRMIVAAMNYPTVTINYSDLFSAMQTGACDGWFGGTAELNYNGFRDVIKHYIRYNALLENNVILMNKEKWESLPEGDRKVLYEACIEECVGSFDRAEENDAANVKKLEDYGIEVHELSAEQLDTIAQYVREQTWDTVEQQLTSEVMDAVRADLGQ